MTIPSSDNPVETKIKAVLDDEVEHQLPSHVINDITQARKMALSKAQPKGFSHVTMRTITDLLQVRFIMPAAIAATVMILVNYSGTHSNYPAIEVTKIPAMPASVLDESIPQEDLLLLQDIEFASWLALQEIESEEVVL